MCSVEILDLLKTTKVESPRTLTMAVWNAIDASIDLLKYSLYLYCGSKWIRLWVP